MLLASRAPLQATRRISTMLMQQSRDAASAATQGGTPQEVAVVGGGIAGLVCATALARNGCAVSLFDMGKHKPGEAHGNACWPRCHSNAPHACMGMHYVVVGLW